MCNTGVLESHIALPKGFGAIPALNRVFDLRKRSQQDVENSENEEHILGCKHVVQLVDLFLITPSLFHAQSAYAYMESFWNEPFDWAWFKFSWGQLIRAIDGPKTKRGQ